tara:strand:- start:2055 stop:2564 length:510 start_codon:yes stop_codon:yes gene_type:complete
MLTKQQKKEQIAQGAELIKGSHSVLFVDFSGVPVTNLQSFRSLLREAGAKMAVIKKRLLKLSFQEAGVDYDPTQFDAQAAVIFVPDEIVSVAGSIHNFAKALAGEEKELNVLGGYDLKDKKIITLDEFNILAKLPTKEVLLAQVAIVFTMPIKKLMFALNSRKEQLETQ